MRPPPNLPFPPFYATSNIVVGQGSGTGDSASVTYSTVPGSISITQKDVAGSPGDSATIDHDTVGYTETIGTTVLAAFPGNLTILQGNASIDTATVSNSTAIGGNVLITQGNGGGTILVPPGDSATVTGVTAGTRLSNGTIVGGNITINQGTGSDDSATVSGSTALGNVSITQKDVAANPSGDSATVSGDTVTGNITILQGFASGDIATIDPTSAGGNVTITQFDGAGDTATADLTSVGGNVTISQGNGGSDTATVDVTTTVGGYVSISQGNGGGDTATVDVTTVGGYVSISQGNGGGDTATVDPLSVGGYVTISQGNGGGDTATVGTSLELTTVGGYVSISQGSGSGDSATVLDVTVGGNITITQSDVAGNATGDIASVLGVTAGSSAGSPFPIEVGGLVTIIQGNAPGDVALLNGDGVNNVAITQGDNVQVLNGSTVAKDVAEINDTTVTSNIVIIQGTGFSTAPDAGLYVAAIGFDYLGYISGTPASSFVTAGGYTIIYQNYANNQVFLGDATSLFTTNYLDVYTGSGGGDSSSPRTRPSSPGLSVYSTPLATPSTAAGPAIPTSTAAATAESPSTRLPSTLDTDAFRKATLHTPPRGGRVADRPGNPRPVFFFGNLSPATTGSGTASSLEIGGGIREGVATREGEASSGPASSRETSRSGIGNRRDVGHGPDGDGHPRLTSPGGCGSVRRLAGPPTPLPFLLCSREGRSSRHPSAQGAVKKVKRSSRPCLLAPPPAQRASVAGGCPTGSPDPAHRPAEISTVTGGAAEVGDGVCTHQPYPTPGGPPAPPTTRSPTRTPCVLFCHHHVLIFQHTVFYDIAVKSSVRDAWNAITTQSSTLGVFFITRSVCCEV